MAYKASYKLSPPFYGPFQIIQRVGEVAYKLDLPQESAIHPVFNAYCLKAKLEKHNISIPLLPSVNSYGVLTPEPVVVFQTKSHQLCSRTITQRLI